MNIVVLFLCLIIIVGILTLSILNKHYSTSPSCSEEYWGRRGWARGGWPRGWARGGWPGRWYGRGIIPVSYYPYYPQSLAQETCLNQCCDYGKCIAGSGCNWKGTDNRWHVGTPTQCLIYRNCANNSIKPDRERHLECSAKAGI
jgi:hypothetical protein